MALPSGYRELEYIQSTGTQYVDTGIKGTSSVRASVEFAVNELGSGTTFVFGAQGSDSARYTLGMNSSGAFRSDFGTEMKTGPSVVLGTRYTADKNGNVCTINGTKVSNTAQTFTGTTNIYLFARSYSSLSYSKIKLYYCKIYDNGTLVRDFTPCANASGEIGLWDNVGSKFYANAGAGSFVAGPYAVIKIDAPENFRQTAKDYFSLSLAWDAAEGATSYKLYRDGALLATLTGTAYTDTDVSPNSSYVYTVTGVNSEGEGEPAQLTASTSEGYVVQIIEITEAVLAPNPADINTKVKLSVAVSEAIKILEPYYYFSGDLYAGEV